MKKNILNSPRLVEARKKKKKIIKRKIILALLGILALFIAFVLVLRISSFNISEVTVFGNKIIDTEDVQKIVRDNMSGNYIWFIPKTSTLLYPKQKIIRALEEERKRIKDLKVEVKDRVLEVSLSEREGVYTWCGDELPPNGVGPEKTKCYFTDDSGYVFDEAPYFSNDVYLKFFGPLEDSKYEPKVFRSLVNFLNSIKGMDLEPSSVLSKDDEIEVYLASGMLPPDSPKIIFEKNGDYILLSKNLESALTVEPFTTDIKKKYTALLYIDLRFDNRVYYKFK